MNEKDLKLMVEQLVSQMVGQVDMQSVEKVVKEVSKNQSQVESDEFIPDITEIDIKKQLLVDNPADREAYLEMKAKTPARLGSGRAGARYKTITALRMRADHAAAQDSVFSDVSEEFIKKNNFIPVKTMCTDKDEYVTRPDLGRRFSSETTEIIKEKCDKNSKVQIMVGDGLSSAAIEANVEDILPSIEQGLKMYGLNVGPILFVKYCRVPAMDAVGEATGADVVCLLVGERPGLVTAESMSAYIAYKPKVGMPEAKRTVISNIHKGGTTAVEAGAHIAELIKTMLDKKASGIDLK
ncbi:ethanolamine ammonia-lyase subunit EutC [Clostridium perfringens]|uniref:ethanolamine ammonia-lyase subunit EutC n=1 Tax=Clostridium perfringens TaxID=1502 RepID=UPI00016BD372|nr:ethanolamine ammonia-lyase subunit EutC [Clostridium perfringens]EDT28213.1 ethanolamine ammonia-lyase, small subunit [Clostridium perfringens CPE str. F4969]EGT0680591.1 ethanolamine ammonia-lyase subunit EutC [Clostridium perfringens]MDH5069001.1 Ethanolamine ammonia-lyase light chain [Clostridium perfringens]MDH5089008.1 Ethanolamine ammonia-lyase light chain [Clostridium perfringens]MDU2093426.1 ethanolamine ammonia-lyase subunit EutC [Clostridium perfringens]